LGKARETLTRLYDVEDNAKANLDVMSDLYSTGAEVFRSGNDQMSGEEFVDLYKAFAAALPDMSHEFVVVIEEGSLVAYEVIATGTFTGSFATGVGVVNGKGQKMVLRFAGILDVGEDGRIVRDYAYFDSAGMLKQLGLSTS
jgi:predicted ester cyclase